MTSEIGFGSLTSLPALISPDQRYVLCASGNRVRIYAVSSALCIATLRCSLPSLPTADDAQDAAGAASSVADDFVVAMWIPDENSLRLHTVTASGVALVWDYMDGVLLSHQAIVPPKSGKLASWTVVDAVPLRGAGVLVRTLERRRRKSSAEKVLRTLPLPSLLRTWLSRSLSLCVRVCVFACVFYVLFIVNPARSASHMYFFFSFSLYLVSLSLYVSI